MTGIVEEAVFEITHRFAAPRARVWRAWTDPDQLARWFGPKGCTAEILEFELAPGGLWRSRLVMADGMAVHSSFKFREVTAPTRLVYEHRFADAEGNIITAPFFDRWPRVLLTEVDFVDAGATTEVSVRWTPLDAAPDEVAIFVENIPSMTGGWSGSFAQLEALLAE